MFLTIQGRYSLAAWFILLAMVFDFLDGYVARITKSFSRFGVEYDSMADLTTFGLAPTLLVYRAFLVGLGRLGVGAAFLYSVSAALRLARFNVQIQSEEKEAFTGLPTPAAAGILATLVLLINKYSWNQGAWLPVVMALLSYLMISTIRFAAFTKIEIHKRKPFVYLAVAVLLLAALIFYAEICLFLVFIGYAGFNLYLSVFHHRQWTAETKGHPEDVER